MTRFTHSSHAGYDLTGIGTREYKLEYLIHFEGVARPGDLPLLSHGRLDSVSCGKAPFKMQRQKIAQARLFRHIPSENDPLKFIPWPQM